MDESIASETIMTGFSHASLSLDDARRAMMPPRASIAPDSIMNGDSRKGKLINSGSFGIRRQAKLTAAARMPSTSDNIAGIVTAREFHPFHPLRRTTAGHRYTAKGNMGAR